MNRYTGKVLLEDLLKRIVGIIGDDMRKKGRVASGRTLKNISTETAETAEGVRGVVWVPQWFPYIERGSAPAPRGKWFFSVIHEWAKDKSIIGDDSPQSRKISGAIAHSIIYNGTEAYRLGGVDVFTTDVEKALNDFADSVSTEVVRSVFG